MILRHADMLCNEKGEYTAVREMRQHMAWYSAGFKGSASFRRAVNEVDTISKLKELMEAGTNA